MCILSFMNISSNTCTAFCDLVYYHSITRFYFINNIEQ